MLEPLATPVINRLLRANTWALDRLRAHAGKTAALVSPPVELRLTVLESGEVAAAPRDGAANVTITAPAGVLLRLAARDESAWTAAEVSGDLEFAAAIDYVRRNLTWDYEEDLSRVFGDVAAHRMAGAVREIDRWGRATARNLAESFLEYATYEQPVLAAATELDAFNREVDDVRDHAARLEKRIELIQRRLSGA
jgi:ubiquinone biosynthesis protein UbiJ